MCSLRACAERVGASGKDVTTAISFFELGTSLAETEILPLQAWLTSRNFCELHRKCGDVTFNRALRISLSKKKKSRNFTFNQLFVRENLRQKLHIFCFENKQQIWRKKTKDFNVSKAPSGNSTFYDLAERLLRRLQRIVTVFVRKALGLRIAFGLVRRSSNIFE